MVLFIRDSPVWFCCKAAGNRDRTHSAESFLLANSLEVTTYCKYSSKYDHSLSPKKRPYVQVTWGLSLGTTEDLPPRVLSSESGSVSVLGHSPPL